jgi:hypothetical protein
MLIRLYASYKLIEILNKHWQDQQYMRDGWLWNSWTITLSSAHSHLRHMVFVNLLNECIRLKGVCMKELQGAIKVFRKYNIGYVALIVPSAALDFPAVQFCWVPLLLRSCRISCLFLVRGFRPPPDLPSDQCHKERWNQSRPSFLSSLATGTAL